jgi:hypothetical protein
LVEADVLGRAHPWRNGREVPLPDGVSRTA